MFEDTNGNRKWEISNVILRFIRDGKSNNEYNNIRNIKTIFFTDNIWHNVFGWTIIESR